MDLKNARVAVLVENLYQELELWYPVLRLREEGVNVTVVGPSTGEVFASKIGYPATADVAVEDVSAEDFDAVIVPGGFSPEYLRRNRPFVDLVRETNAAGTTLAAICHAGWLLASADVVDGRRVTSVAPIKDDVIHAGGKWIDESVVEDGNLVTAQLPNDLPDFMAAVLRKLAAAPEVERAEAPYPNAVSATYEAEAVLKNRAAGPGSANYRAYAVLAPADSAAGRG